MGPEICISNKLPADTDAVAPRTPLGTARGKGMLLNVGYLVLVAFYGS